MASIDINENDKKFLSYLGRATDVTTTLDDWMETADDGKPVRSVKEDHSNVEARSPGKRISKKRTDVSKSKRITLSANANIGAGPTIPVGGKVRAGFFRSRKNRLVKLDNLISFKKLVFKDDTLSFPTQFEKDMCKYVVEWLKQHESSESHSTSVTIVDGSDHVKMLDQFIQKAQQTEETLDDLMGAIDNYTMTQLKATHYVSAITLGARKDEIRKINENTTEIDGEGGIKAGNIGGIGATGGRKVEEKEETCQEKELGGIRTVADSSDGEAVQQQLAIVRVKITRISELVKNPKVKCLLNMVIDMYQERKKEIEKRDLIGPVRILCDDDGLKVYWRVATEDGAAVIIGTTNRLESSQFYFEDRGNGIIYILHYTGNVTVDNRRILAVQRSQDANPLKIVTVRRCKEPYRLEFEMKEFKSKCKKKMTANDWVGPPAEYVYIRVRSAKQYRMKRFWPKFYIEMKEFKIQGQPTKYKITFLSEDKKKSKDHDDPNSEDDLLLFRSEMIETDSGGHLQDHTRIRFSGGSCKSKAESTTSFVAEKPPSESELQIQSDSSSTDTEVAEMSEYPSFDMLVSEDYILPDFYITQEEGRVE